MSLIVLTRNVSKVDLLIIWLLKVSYVGNSRVVSVRNDLEYLIIGMLLLKFLSARGFASG